MHISEDAPWQHHVGNVLIVVPGDPQPWQMSGGRSFLGLQGADLWPISAPASDGGGLLFSISVRRAAGLSYRRGRFSSAQLTDGCGGHVFGACVQMVLIDWIVC